MSNSPGLELLVSRPSGSRLVQAYLAAEEAAEPFFGPHFSRAASYEGKAAELDRRFDRDERASAAEGVFVPPTGDPARLERFVEEGGYMVTTGQQAGLFGGPLYNVLKGLTAVRVAATLEERLGKPVLPLFWVSSEDHDWDEACHAELIGLDNSLHSVALEHPEDEVLPPLHRIVLGRQIDAAVDTFLELLPDTDFSAEYRELIRESFRPEGTLVHGFHEVLQHLLGRFGLLFTDSMHPAVKRASMPLVRRELEASEALEEVLSGTATALEDAGFGLQVPILEGGVNLFLEGPAGRERLYRQDGGFRLRSSGTQLTAEEVAQRLEADPTLVSANVLSRPVVESAVFPTLAYVGGPGEMAYFGQLRTYFEAHGIRMPVVYPRFTVTPVESKIRKVLDKFGLDVDALDRPFHEIAGDLARDEMPDEVRAALGKLKGALGSGMGEVEKAVRDVDPTLKGPAQQARSQALAALDDLEKKVVQAVKRQSEISLQQLEKAQVHLFPSGKPAERVQSPFYYLVRYGGGFLDALYDRFEVELA